MDDGSTDGTVEIVDGDRRPTRDGLRAADQPRQGRGTAPRVRRGERRLRDRPGRRPRVRPRGVLDDARPAARRRRRRRLRLALPVRSSAPRPLLLALGGQPVPHHRVEHVHQPQPHRHGDLLQGVPPRGHPVDRDRGGPLRFRAGDHREDRRRRVGASTRSGSRTPAGPTPRARRSAGETGCARCTASCATRRRGTRCGRPSTARRTAACPRPSSTIPTPSSPTCLRPSKRPTTTPTGSTA